MDSVGGGGSSRNFPGSIFSGGGVVAEIFRDPYRDPYSVGGGGSSRHFPGSIFSGGGGGSSRKFSGSRFCGVAEFFPLTTVTDPKFVFFSVKFSYRP